MLIHISYQQQSIHATELVKNPEELFLPEKLLLKMLCQIFGRFDPKFFIQNSIGILMGVEKVTSFHLSHCSKKSANYT